MAFPADKRTRNIAIALAAVLVLTAVIVVVSMLPGGRESDATRDESRLEQRDLTQEASDALRAGDATSALELATLALAKDPNDSRAREVASQAKRAQSSKQSGGSSADSDETQNNAGDDSAEDEAGTISDPAALLPKEFSGFTFGSTVALDGDYSVSASARTGTSPVRTVLWAIHDAKTPEGAEAFLTKTSKVLYAKDATAVEVDGAQGYFGTDGTRYASTVYTSGRYVFEVLVSGTDGAPAGYRDTAVSAAKAFAEQP